MACVTLEHIYYTDIYTNKYREQKWDLQLFQELKYVLTTVVLANPRLISVSFSVLAAKAIRDFSSHRNGRMIQRCDAYIRMDIYVEY